MIRLLLALLIGGIPASQAVPFTDAYLHNLGGRVAELRLIVSGYVERAEARGVSLDDHLGYFEGSTDAVIRDEGVAMRRTVERYSRLRRTMLGIQRAPPILHPVLVLENLDRDVARTVLDRFNPGLTASIAQLFYFVGGLAALWIGLAALALCGRGARRAVRRGPKPA